MNDQSSPLSPETVLGISEGLDFVLISDNEVLVQFGSRSYPSELLRDTALTGILGRLITRLLGEAVSVSDLLSGLSAQEQAEGRALLNDLFQRGFLADVKKSLVEQYLSYTFTGESTLAQRSISLIGGGPIGVRLAQSFLQHGVGRVTLLDDRKADHVWYRNIPPAPNSNRSDDNRVHLLLRDRLLAAGHSNVEILDCQLDAVGIEAAVKASDFTVVAFEQPHLRVGYFVNRSCIRHRKPWLLATIDGNFGLIGPLFLPVHTACYNDYRTLSDAATRTPHMTRKYRDHILQRDTSSFFCGLPVYADIVAGYASLAALHFLLRDTSFALGRVLAIDYDRMIIDVEDVLKLPRCPVCGDEKIAYQPPFSAEIVTRYSSMIHEPGHNIPK